MKRAFKLVIVIFSLFLTFLLANGFDRNDSLKYFSYLDEKSYSFNINKDTKLSQALINELDDKFSNIGVLITKTVYYDGYRNIYVGGSAEEYFEFLKKFDINFDNYELFEKTESPFVATYDTKEKNQIFNSKDFMNNDKLRFYRIKDIEKSGGYAFGNYNLSYEDVSKDNINNILDSTIEGLNVFDNTESIISVTSNRYYQYSAILVMILLVFLIVTSVFTMYDASKKISIMFLQGYKFKDALIELTKSTYFILIMTYLVSSILLIMFVANISFKFWMMHSLSYLALITVYSLITSGSLYLISKSSSIVSSLKKRNLTGKILIINTFFKLAVSILLILLSFNVAVELSTLLERTILSKDIRDIANIVVHEGLVSNQDEELNADEVFDKLNIFFGSLEGTDIDLFVSEFSAFSTPDDAQLEDVWFKDLHEQELKMLEAREFYFIARVDRNYLIKENIEVYDKSNKIVDLTKALAKRVYLVPESELEYIDKLETYINTLPDSSSEENKIKEFEYYTYKDRSFKTYTPNFIVDSQVDSPIIELMDYGTSTSFSKYAGISVAGGGHNTNVKFPLNRDLDKVTLYNKQIPYLRSAEVLEYLPLMNFVAYGEMYGQEGFMAVAGLITMLVLTASLLGIYIMITLQQLKLYNERKRKVLSVKKMLGYKPFDIYKEIYFITIGILVTSILLSLAYSKTTDLEFSIWVVLIILFIEIIVISISTIRILKSNTVLRLKGN